MVFKPLSCVFGSFVIQQRYVLVFMLHFALLNAYHLRVALNIAINEMTASKNDTVSDACPEYSHKTADVKENQFDWPPWVEAFILYAFYIGYIVGHLPGGWLADKLGARHVMGTCMLLSTIITLVFPITLEKGGAVAAIVLRSLLGLAQGPLFPTISTFIQSWVPGRQRGFLGGVAFGGSNLGTVTGNTLTGIIIQQTQSWAIPFYVWGLCALVWYVFYMLLVFSRPSSHPFITEEEHNILKEELEEKKKFKVPWAKIATNIPVYALLVAQFGHNYIFFTMVTDLPKYLKEVLKMDITSNAVFSSIPFLFLWISNILFAFLADFFTNRKWLSVLNCRKIFTIFSLIAPSAVLLIVVYVKCNREAAIALYTLSLFCIGPFFSGMKVNVNDLTHHYGGIIMAIVNGLGATAGILGPWVVGHMTKNATFKEWEEVYWIMLAVCVASSVFYGLFASADRQPWDYPEEDEK